MKPSDGTCWTGIRASYVFCMNRVTSKPTRPLNIAPSNPNSSSRLRSGPSAGLPSVTGVTPGFPSSAEMGSQVRTASNDPGARPDSPHAARSFMPSHQSGQKLSSEML